MPTFSKLLAEITTRQRGGRSVITLLVGFWYGPYSAPSGFESDGASVPRLLWPIANPFGRATHAAVIHDRLYQTQEIFRPEADWVFLEAMADLGVAWWRRNLMWLAVKAFGGFYWHRCAACLAGEPHDHMKIGLIKG